MIDQLQWQELSVDGATENCSGLLLYHWSLLSWIPWAEWSLCGPNSTPAGGISCISTMAVVSSRNCASLASKISTVILAVELPLLFMNPFFEQQTAQVLVIMIGSPFSARRFLPWLLTMAVAALYSDGCSHHSTSLPYRLNVTLHLHIQLSPAVELVYTS